MVNAINKKKQIGSTNLVVKVNFTQRMFFLPLRDESKIQNFFEIFPQ